MLLKDITKCHGHWQAYLAREAPAVDRGPQAGAVLGLQQGSGGSGGPAPATPPPTSMFHVEGGQLRIGVPVPEVRPMYSATEQKTYGVSGNATQVQMPMLRVRF